MISRLKDLEEAIKYKFNSKDLLTRCLTHKSYDENINNEKLEFLGDRVLGLVISISYIGFNSSVAPFDDIKFRQSLTYAIDKEMIAREIYSNLVVPAYGVLPPGFPGYNPNLIGLKYDIEKAKLLLSQSIYADESTMKSEYGDVLEINTDNDNIKQILHNLFYDILNICLMRPVYSPSEFIQMTRYFVVSIGFPSPIICSHHPVEGSSSDEAACADGDRPVKSRMALSRW